MAVPYNRRFVLAIKNSTTTRKPPTLKQGELAYSFVAGDSDDAGRLYIGTADSGVFHTIGGQYYTDMMDHPRGQVHPLSSIITDANGKINKIDIDNINIDGNSITSTDADGSIVLDPNGNGVVSVSTSLISNVVDPVSAQDAATKNYVDTKSLVEIFGDVNVGDGVLGFGEDIKIEGGFNTNTRRTELVEGAQVKVHLDSDVLGLSRLTVDNVDINGNTIATTSGNLTLDPHAPGATGTVIIAGNLQVDGTTTTINSTTVDVDDKNLTLASGAINAAAADSAGISVDGANAFIFYKSSTDTWNFNKKVIADNIDVTGTISTSSFSGQYLGFDSDLQNTTTDRLPEGSTNLYYTNERVDDRVAALLSMAEGLDASYNDSSGVLTLSTELATSTNIGAASFDSVDFLVTAGNVEIQTIDCGIY